MAVLVTCSQLSYHPAAALCMLHMVAVKRLDVTVVVVGVSCRASCKATAVVESLAAAIVLDSSVGREMYLLVNLSNNGSTSAADFATENAGL